MTISDGITTQVVSAPNAARLEVKATFTLYGLAVGANGEHVTELERIAAESVLQAAGLRAAVYFGADIMPFVQLGQGIKRGDEMGHVAAIVNAANDCYIRIAWPGDVNDDRDPDDIADDLRAGVLVLA